MEAGWTGRGSGVGEAAPRSTLPHSESNSIGPAASARRLVFKCALTPANASSKNIMMFDEFNKILFAS
jgi:hypothetical protein